VVLPTSQAYSQEDVGGGSGGWVIPALGPLVASGDVLHVTVCVVDPNSPPLCDTLYVAIDDTPPVMSWVNDSLPATPAYASYAAAHPFTLGATGDVAFQVRVGVNVNVN
jgi:hypothetical protein